MGGQLPPAPPTGYATGSYSAPDAAKSDLFAELILALDAITDEPTFQDSARRNAKVLMDHFMKFETILTAMVFLKVYKVTTPSSLYLQTKGLDMLQAWRMVGAVTMESTGISRDFESTRQKAKDFCALVNESLDDTDLEIDAVLPKKQARKKKRMSDERCPDVLDEVENYRINTFNVIMDSMGKNLKRRFLDREQSYKDFACFDPRRFKELKQSGIPSSATSKVCKVFVGKIDIELLVTQLESFMDFVYGFSRLVMSLIPEEIVENNEEELEDGVVSSRFRFHDVLFYVCL